MQHTRLKRIGGLTLPELCLSLALLALLAGMSVPGFRASQRSAAVRTATFDLLAGLQQARAGSILESRPGLLCVTDAQGSCLAAARPGIAWRSFLETGAIRDELARQTLPPGIEVRATRSPLRFWPDSLSASTGTLTICDTRRLASPRAIVISQGGRARLDQPARNACAI